MTSTDRRVEKLREKKYREEFVANQLRRAIPLQIRALMRKKKISQQELAERAGLTQGVISRSANPAYGRMTLNTIIRVAAGFDLAFIGVFVPFSKLVDYFNELSEDSVPNIPTFEEEFGEVAVARKEAEADRTRKLLEFPDRSGQKSADAQMRPSVTPASDVVIGRITPKSPNPPLDPEQQSSQRPELYGLTDADRQQDRSA